MNMLWCKHLLFKLVFRTQKIFIFNIELEVKQNEVKTENQELIHDLNLRVIKKQHIM